MSAVGPIEFPDLDFLINAAENRSEESSGEGNSSDKGAFDPDEYAGFVQWYSEQSNNLQQHYETHIEHQKQKLAEENEAGLLEALQQSLENFEYDHMSDFASLSSLDACSIPTPSSASVAESSSDGFEKQSVLKELLLSPLSESYPKEIDSPEHIVSDHIKKLGISSPEKSSSDRSAISKPRVSKIMKPFAELLKHMEASESTATEKDKTSISQRPKQSGTRLVNTKRYMSKYASATNNKIEPPSDKVEGQSLGKRFVLNSMKNDSQNNKTLTLSLKPNSTARFINSKPLTTGSNIIATGGFTTSKNVPIFSTSPTSLETVAITSPKLAEKRAATPPSEQLDQKKRCLCPSGTTNLSVDHDYCAIQSNGSSRDETAADEKTQQLEIFTAPECPKSPAKTSNAQKVLKWEEYLQQVRAGVRSAPNSPATSPKVARGSARSSNNFMNVSLRGHQIPPKSLVNAKAGSGKINGKVPIPEALRKKTVKQNFGLQEFDRYISVLQNNLSSPSKNTETADTPAEAISVSPAISAAKVETSTSPTFSAAHSLVAMVQQQQSEVLQETKKATPYTKQQASMSQNILKNECIATKKQQKLVSIPRTSGQLLMIKVPVSGTTARKASARKSSPLVPAVTPSVPLPKTVVTRGPSVGPSISTSVPQQTQVSPTFKLMTSSKDGTEPKSLILSGVTGKLKDILTHMAEQQAKAKSQNGGKQEQPVSSENQLNTLQKLIACLSSQPNLKLDPVATSNPSQMAVAKEIHVDSPKETPVVKSSSSGPATSLLHTPEKSQSPIKMSTDFEETSHSEITPANLEQEQPKTIPSTLNGNDIVDGGASVVKIAPAKDEILQSDVVQSKVVPQTRSTEVKQPTSKPEHLGPVGGSTSQPVAMTSASPKDSSENRKLNSVTKFSLTRNMAAAEMLASNVIDDGTEEIMVYSKPEVKSEKVDWNNNEVEFVNDEDPAVITLEEAVARLEDDEFLSPDNSRTTSLSTADNLFCKLPSYFLAGKLMSEEKLEEIPGKPEEDIEGLMMRGMKNVFCDPLVSSKANDLEFNKLPHYLSPGKSSRYGKPYSPVNTFKDEVADAKNDTVSSEILKVDKSEKHRRRSKRKHKKKKKHKRASKREKSSEKVFHSKLPSCYLSGRVLASHEKDKTRRISPLRSRYARSPAPHSLSQSSRSSRSRSRSPLRRSPSRRRRSSRNFSRSVSRSPSESEDESRRSWRRERRSSRYRRERSYDRRSYDSSDEDHDEYIWRREREARQARRQHEDTVEKERERAMEERRVVYVGRINSQMTKQELRRKFLRFGDIEAVSLHFRDDGDSYGFLTFQYTSDAFRAIEEGRNLGPDEPRYDLCFGGRRQFCKSLYQDLDSKVAESDDKPNDLNDFDALLQQARRSIRR